MTLLKIARMGHPVLLQPALPVADPQAPAVHVLVADMIETMLDAQGAGLAAPQVHQACACSSTMFPPPAARARMIRPARLRR